MILGGGSIESLFEKYITGKITRPVWLNRRNLVFLANLQNAHDECKNRPEEAFLVLFSQNMIHLAKTHKLKPKVVTDFVKKKGIKLQISNE
jgi:hypothetical protein